MRRVARGAGGLRAGGDRARRPGCRRPASAGVRRLPRRARRAGRAASAAAPGLGGGSHRARRRGHRAARESAVWPGPAVHAGPLGPAARTPAADHGRRCCGSRPGGRGGRHRRVAGGAAARPPAASSAPAWTGTSRAASQQTRASATVRYAASRWGLRLSVQVTGIRPGTACELEVINRGGQEVAAGSWTITGRPGAWYPASAAVPLSGIRGFVLSAGSRTLVRLPARADIAVPPGSPAGRS